MVSTYLLEVSPLENQELFKKYYSKMSPYRREKIDRKRLVKDKKLSLGAGILLDFALKKHGLYEKDMQYLSSDNGKPYFKNHPSLHFNISHSENCVICSFSDSAVGCDIEKISTPDLRIANRFFAKKEKSFITSLKSTEEQNESFYRIWTLKESYIKFTGKGLSQGLASFEFDLDGEICVYNNDEKQNVFFKEYKTHGHRIAVCCEKNEFSEKIELINLTPYLR